MSARRQVSGQRLVIWKLGVGQGADSRLGLQLCACLRLSGNLSDTHALAHRGHTAACILYTGESQTRVFAALQVALVSKRAMFERCSTFALAPLQQVRLASHWPKAEHASADHLRSRTRPGSRRSSGSSSSRLPTRCSRILSCGDSMTVARLLHSSRRLDHCSPHSLLNLLSHL